MIDTFSEDALSSRFRSFSAWNIWKSKLKRKWQLPSFELQRHSEKNCFLLPVCLLTLTLLRLWGVSLKAVALWILSRYLVTWWFCCLLMERGTQKPPAALWRQQALWSWFNVMPCSVSHAAPYATSFGITSAPPWSAISLLSSLSKGTLTQTLSLVSANTEVKI